MTETDKRMLGDVTQNVKPVRQMTLAGNGACAHHMGSARMTYAGDLLMLTYERGYVAGQEPYEVMRRRADFIRYWMEQSGLGSRDLAELMTVKEREVQRWIKPEHAPSEANLVKLSRLMKVPVERLRQPPFPRSPYPELEASLGPEGRRSLRLKALDGKVPNRPRLRRPRGGDGTRR